ncbi:MAG: cyclic nucleotide-binding domain-containing protein [Deltaproteobacteria bacterium]|nr:cyclic nucleotide-binding domain-containing protein [Deltaproteobacteria bacterium]
MKVLVMDFFQESRAFLKTALRTLNFVEEVREKGNPVGLTQALDEIPFNVVMIDANLPDADVFGLAKLIKSHPTGATSGLVLMGTDLDVEVRRKGIEAGYQSFLERPFDMNSLEKAIRDSMGRISTNYKDTLDKVRRIQFFSGFSDVELVRLLKMCHTRKYREGEYVIRQGEKGDRMYLLLAGKVNIVKEREGNQELMATCGPGECFGEMAVVDSEPRSAHAVTASECMVMEIHNEIFKDVNDLLALKLFRKIALLVTQKLRTYSNTRT